MYEDNVAWYYTVRYGTVQQSTVQNSILSLAHAHPLILTLPLTLPLLLSLSSTPHSTQISLEDSFTNYAVSTGQDSVILCDRGVMDGRAYVPADTWSTDEKKLF